MTASAEAVPDQLPVIATSEAESVLGVLADISGGMSLRKACEAHSLKMPTFLRWTVEDATLSDQYMRARISQAAFHADEILTIADNQEEESKSRAVRIDARKWVAARLHPKQWGDKVEVTGKDGAPLNGPANLDAGAVVDGLVALAVQHPIAAIPLRKLLESALARIPIPE